MLASKIKEIRNGRVIVKDSKTKDEKIFSISTPQWEGDIRIIDNTHFEMKAKGSDKWTWALHIAQADDHILNALKAKGALKDNGRFFTSDSKTKDANIVNAGNIKGINWKVRKDIKNGNVIYIGESDLDDETFEGAYSAQVAKELMNWIIRHAGN